MSQSVRAAVAVANGTTEIRELPKPETAPNTGILRVELTGICGSDWPYYNRHPGNKGPLILGHETVGRVAELGREAATHFGVREGDRVALEEYLPCGHCRYCQSGESRLCDETDTLNRTDSIRYGSTALSIAPGLWGGFANHKYLHPSTMFHLLPDSVTTELATLALPLGNGVEWAYLQGGAKLGETVLIQGPGQQGLACIVAAREAGAGHIIVTGLSTPQDKARLALAKKLGASHVVTVDTDDQLETVADITAGEMADLVIDCAAGGPETILSAISCARKSGRVILGGWKRQPIPAFESDDLVRRFLTIKGMRGHSYTAVELGIGIIASGRYPLGQMCTHVFPLAETDYALRTVGGEGASGAIHCAIDPWQ